MVDYNKSNERREEMNKERMPRTNPHASVLKQDKQLREQLRWLRRHGFRNPREAQEAGY